MVLLFVKEGIESLLHLGSQMSEAASNANLNEGRNKNSLFSGRMLHRIDISLKKSIRKRRIRTRCCERVVHAEGVLCL